MRGQCAHTNRRCADGEHTGLDCLNRGERLRALQPDGPRRDAGDQSRGEMSAQQRRGHFARDFSDRLKQAHGSTLAPAPSSEEPPDN